jgi:hypothetical protein
LNFELGFPRFRIIAGAAHKDELANPSPATAAVDLPMNWRLDILLATCCIIGFIGN